MTATIQLDPDALEASARYLCNQFWGYDGADSVLIAGDGTEQWVEHKDEAQSIVTAYIAAIEPRLRERVARLSNAAMDNGIVLQSVMSNYPEGDKDQVIVTPELSAAVNDKYAAHEAIFALFGLEPNE